MLTCILFFSFIFFAHANMNFLYMSRLSIVTTCNSRLSIFFLIHDRWGRRRRWKRRRRRSIFVFVRSPAFWRSGDPPCLSLTIECVPLLQMCSLTTECVPLLYNVFPYYRMCSLGVAVTLLVCFWLKPPLVPTGGLIDVVHSISLHGRRGGRVSL